MTMPTTATIRRGLLALALAALAGCAGGPTARAPLPAPDRPLAAAPSAPVAGAAVHDNLNAVLWVQTSVEYAATTRSVYAAATALLDDALADPRWDALPPAERGGQRVDALLPAIILDVDETVLDNSAYQARLIGQGTAFDPDTWDGWVQERRAPAVPGVTAFLQAAAQRGITVFYVTNRNAAGKVATVDNLRALRLPLSEPEDTVLTIDETQGWGSAKGSRRQFVGERYRVLMMLGDNLGDFVDGYNTGVQARAALVEPYDGWWGRRWFMLPNPTYGSWESAITRGSDDPGAARRAALRER